MLHDHQTRTLQRYGTITQLGLPMFTRIAGHVSPEPSE
jgi:hypothetical protein